MLELAELVVHVAVPGVHEVVAVRATVTEVPAAIGSLPVAPWSWIEPEMIDAVHVLAAGAVTLATVTALYPAGTAIVADPRSALLPVTLVSVRVYGLPTCPAVSLVGAIAAE